MPRSISRWTACSLLTLSVTLGGGLLTTVSAQSPTVPSVPAGAPFKVAFDHDGLNTTHYRVLLGGKQVAEVPASARVGGVVTIDMAALPAGAYSIVAVARNAPTVPFTDPAEASSPAYAFEVHALAPKPTPPSWRATVLIFADGSMRIEDIARVDVPTLRLPGVR